MMESLAKSRVKATVVTKGNLSAVKKKCVDEGRNGVTKACLKSKGK